MHRAGFHSREVNESVVMGSLGQDLTLNSNVVISYTLFTPLEWSCGLFLYVVFV